MDKEVEARAKLTKKDNIKKFRELQQYLEEDIPQSISEKKGQAATVRLAIRMAHNQMKDNKEELKDGWGKVEEVKARRNKEAKNL